MLDWMSELFENFATALTEVLPLSPFRPFLNQISSLPFLPYLNWLVPVGFMINVLEAWLGAISIFYLYSIVMRWVKMIGD